MNKVKQIGLMLIAFILSSSILCNVVSADEFYPKDYNAYKIQYPENVYSIDYGNNVALEFILLPDSNARSTTSKTGYGRFYLVDSGEDLAKFSLKSAFWYDGNSSCCISNFRKNELSLGNFKDITRMKSVGAREVFNRKDILNKHCKKCEFLAACWGGCLYELSVSGQDITKSVNCRRSFYECVVNAFYQDIYLKKGN